ncbi:MAG: RidA family protein [Rhodobacteraceae bacterium]|nr:RidA family protein [Paracoccaceae bacterium]
MTDAYENLHVLGLRLPPPAPAAGNFVPGMQSGDLLFLSGAIGTAHDGASWSLPIRGKLGAEVSVEDGRRSAELCALNHLSAIHALTGDLGRVRQVIKLTGHVNAAPGFTKAPLVLDGASDLLLAVFGRECGRHARVATYQPEMSFHAPLETELIVQICG